MQRSILNRQLDCNNRVIPPNSIIYYYTVHAIFFTRSKIENHNRLKTRVIFMTKLVSCVLYGTNKRRFYRILLICSGGIDIYIMYFSFSNDVSDVASSKNVPYVSFSCTTRSWSIAKRRESTPETRERPEQTNCSKSDSRPCTGQRRLPLIENREKSKAALCDRVGGSRYRNENFRLNAVQAVIITTPALSIARIPWHSKHNADNG